MFFTENCYVICTFNEKLVNSRNFFGVFSNFSVCGIHLVLNNFSTNADIFAIWSLKTSQTTQLSKWLFGAHSLNNWDLQWWPKVFGHLVYVALVVLIFVSDAYIIIYVEKYAVDMRKMVFLLRGVEVLIE